MLTDNTSDNQTHNSIDLGTKGDYDRKFDKTENKVPDYDKYITNVDINKLQAEIDEILKQAKLATKGVVDNVELCSI